MVGLKELDQIDYGVAYQRGAPSLTQQSGLAGLVTPTNAAIANANRNAMDDLRSLGNMNVGAPPPQAAAAPQGPVLAISRSSGKIWANGKLFTLDDAQGAIESEQYLNQPPAPAPAAEAGDWEVLDQDAYAQHLASIKNPGMGTLASKNFGIGVDNMQMLGGYGLQFLGATETGQSIVQSQLADINKNAPYQRNFEDIGSDPNRGVLDWFVANLAQQGPNLVESAVTAAIGAMAGGAAGGGPNPVTAVGGAVTAMVGKQAFKQALLGAAKKYAAGEVLDAAEKKLLFEAAGLTAAGIREAAERAAVSTVNAAGQATAPRTAAQFFAQDIVPQLGAAASKTAAGGLSQARLGGAAIATGLQNYATGVSDLYGDSVEGGNPDRGYAALGGVPYAAMESLPEFVAALRIFKGLGARTASLAGKSMLGKAGEIGVRAAQGGAAGAALEGSTELGQEMLGIGANDAVDMDSPEGISRMLNAFAAGAAIGGFIGAGSNMNTGKPHDLLSAGARPADQNAPTLTGEIIPPPQPGGSMGRPDGSVPLLGGPGGAGAAATPGIGAPGMAPPPGPTVSDVQFAQPQVGAPAPGVSPATVLSPSLGQPQGNMLSGPQPSAAALPAPPQPAEAAPAAAAPPVIPLGGQIGGSALQQTATGQLQGGEPPALPNRLQQAQAAAKQRQLEATSGSALARLGRGDLPIPLTQPGGEASMGGEATGQMVQPMTGKAKLKRGKKVMQVEGMPQQAAAPVEATPEVTIPDDPRLIRAQYERITREQARREEFLRNKVKLAAYAKQREISTAEMRKLLARNYEDMKPVLAALERAMASPEFAANEAANKKAASNIKFNELPIDAEFTPDATQEGQVKPGDKLQRQGTGGRLEAGRVNRDITPQVQEAGNPPSRGDQLKQSRKSQKAAAPVEAEVSTHPVHDKFVAEFDDAQLNDANKLKLKAIVKRAKKAGVLTDKDMKELNIAFKDRDMTADDIVPLANSLIEANKTKPVAKATEQGKQDVPAEVKEEVPEVKEPPKLREKPKEDLSPKAEGAAAAPAQKADDEDAAPAWEADVKQIVYGNTEEAYDQRAEYESLDAALWTYWQNISDTLMEQGYKGVELERAYRYAEELFGKRYDTLMAYDGQQQAKARKATTDIVVYNPAPIIDPEKEAYERAQQAKEVDASLLEVRGTDAENEVEVEEAISQIDSAKLDKIELREAVKYLMRMASDSKINKKLRDRVSRYLDQTFEQEELDLFNRTQDDPVTQGSMDFDLITTTMEQINNGELRLTQSIIGRLTAAWKRLRPSNPDYGVGKLADYIKGDAGFFNMKDDKVVPKEPGRYSTTMWDVAENPLSVGKIKLIIGKFISKYANKPKVHIFRNQADLKASDPALYARMAAGRDGDFDTVNAAGYSMGDTVIIFSDRIGSEQHLAFVLAHETLGHFGMRGLMGKADFDKLMNSLYDTDPRLKAAVDAAMVARGLPKAEAVEEYLSDYAGQLHTSLVRRVWNGVKGVLNRVGIRFGDEATRYLLSQAKRYVKTGERAGVFETSSVLNKLWGVESGHVGRFAVVQVASENDAAADMLRWGRHIPMSLKEAGYYLKDGGWTWDKLKEQVFSLANFQALRNPGLFEFRKLMDEASQREQYIYNKYNVKLEKLLNKNEEYRNRISRMMLAGRNVSVFRLMEKPLTAADMNKKLFAINQTTGELEQDMDATKEFVLRGLLSKKEMKEGVTYKRRMMQSDGTYKVEEQKFEGFADLTDEQYEDYVRARNTIAEVEIELLKAKYANFVAGEQVSIGAIKRMLRKADANDTDARKMVKRTANKYKEIYVAGYKTDERGNLQPSAEAINNANNFLERVNRALINADNAGVKNDEVVRKFFEDQKEADDFMVALNTFRSNMKTEGVKFDFQNEMKRLVLDDVSLGVEEERAKRTMAGGYVPVVRDKAFEVRIEAVNENGKVVRLHEDMRQLLVYSQFDNLSEAKIAADTLNGAFADKTFEVYAEQDDGSFGTTKVTLRTVEGPALTEVATDPALNLDEFLHGLRLFDIQLRPEKQAQVIRDLTSSGDQLRKRMEYNVVPGADKNMGIFAMSRHIQLRGATIAKTITRPRMRKLMNFSDPESKALWHGDLSGVFSTYNRWKNATGNLKQHYRHQLDHKLHMYVETYPDAKGWDGSKEGYEKIKDKLRQNNANRYYNTAQQTMEFLERNKLVTESNFGAGKLASTLRAFTSILQLGGSIAQGVMNMVSPYTNWMPYMASYNAKSGFGGGFSTGKVIVAYQTALNQVGVWGLKGGKYNTAEFYEELVQKDQAKTIGLTNDEAEAMAAEIREGKLQPAQANALLGTARTGTTNRWMLKGIDIFMAPFNVTEQASRRSAFLAAYRLAKERNMAHDPELQKTEAGREEFNIRLSEARAFAIQSIDMTMGEYTVLNRPPVWRDGIQSFLYMYKVYPTTTIQMFRRMDKKGQLIMLGTLWFFAGVTGFPFAEDIEDLIDTIAQALGLQMGSVRAAFINAVEDMAPGLSPYLLKGAVNTALGVPADVASRFSMGDFVPGTGILLAGSTIGEEVKDILGPMPAMTLGAAVTARDLAAFPFSEGKTFQGVMRSSPMTLARMLGDTWAYLDNGAIVDKRGYIVSPEMGTGPVISRLLGFYPEAASKQYDAIRIAKRINNYQKEVVAGFRTAWIRERMANNIAGTRRIEQAVDEWNRSAKHTGLEIANFRKNSERAYKEATMSAAERTLKATSKAGREDTARLMDAILATE